MKERKKALPKKELRILFTPEHYARLENVAQKYDMSAAALVRMWAMEKVTVSEAVISQSTVCNFMINDVDKMMEKMKETRK